MWLGSYTLPMARERFQDNLRLVLGVTGGLLVLFLLAELLLRKSRDFQPDFLASALLYGLFSGVLADYEGRNAIVRGEPGSQRSAMVFGEYFPNPALGTDAAAFAKVTHTQAFAAELVGTALLVFFIFAVTDLRNRSRPDGTLYAPAIGVTVAIVISIIAPLTQAGLNPARDFGPRLFSLLIGFGAIAIPGPRGGFFTVYILAPILGGLAGAAAWQYLLRPAQLETLSRESQTAELSETESIS